MENATPISVELMPEDGRFYSWTQSAESGRPVRYQGAEYLIEAFRPMGWPTFGARFVLLQIRGK